MGGGPEEEVLCMTEEEHLRHGRERMGWAQSAWIQPAYLPRDLIPLVWLEICEPKLLELTLICGIFLFYMGVAVFL